MLTPASSYTQGPRNAGNVDTSFHPKRLSVRSPLPMPADGRSRLGMLEADALQGLATCL